MKESFETLFQQSLEKSKIHPGDKVPGKVVKVDDKYVFIDVGLKSEGIIPIEEFKRDAKDSNVQVGDTVDVVVEMLADDQGETRLSREKARRAEMWARLTQACETGEIVKGLVQGRVKGGLTVDINGIKAFLPGSLIDTHIVSNMAEFEGKEFEFKIIKVDDERNNIVVSRRAVIEEASSAERSKLLQSLEEGQILKGTVKNLTDYGAFIDLGGIDGLLHITDISWKRIKSPNEVLKLGDTVTVVILKFDRERNRISLGMKQLSADPWINIQSRYSQGMKLTGKVTNLADYGCFVELEPGIEGLVHTSELDWTNKNIHPSKLVHVGDTVEVVLLEIDEERRRISLSMKQCKPNPWKAFAENHHEKEVIKGVIKSITDFGIFIGLEGGIDGLIHLSDLSWTEPGEQALHHYQKGQEIEAMLLTIDPERERIALGIKHLQSDPFGNYVMQHNKGEMVKARVIEVEPKQAKLELAPEVVGRIKASEYSSEKIEDLTQHLKVDDTFEARILSVNNKERLVNLSMRPVVEADKSHKATVVKEEKMAEPVIRTTLGDLLKEQMEMERQEDNQEESQTSSES